MAAKQIKTAVAWSTPKFILYSFLRRHKVLLYIFFKLFLTFRRKYYIRFSNNFIIEDHQSGIIQNSLFRYSKNIAKNKCLDKLFQRKKNFYDFDNFKKDLLLFKVSNTIDFGLIMEFLIWYHTLKNLFQERKLSKSVLAIDDLTSRSVAFLAVAKLYKKNVSLFVHQSSKDSHCAKIMEFCNLFTHMFVSLQKHQYFFGAKFTGNLSFINPTPSFGSFSKKDSKNLKPSQHTIHQNLCILPGKGAKLLKLILLIKSLRLLDNRFNIFIKLHPADYSLKYFILKLIGLSIKKEILNLNISDTLFIIGNSTAMLEAYHSNYSVSYLPGIDKYSFDENGYIASSLVSELNLSNYKSFMNSFLRQQQPTFRHQKKPIKCKIVSTQLILKQLNS